MMIQIPVFTAIRWMVADISGDIRGFATKREADAFAEGDSSYVVKQIPKTYKQYEFEEAPF